MYSFYKFRKQRDLEKADGLAGTMKKVNEGLQELKLLQAEERHLEKELVEVQQKQQKEERATEKTESDIYLEKQKHAAEMAHLKEKFEKVKSETEKVTATNKEYFKILKGYSCLP